ncbi:MAG TPA: FAD/NAD(P)-binding protein [Stellaceae bacterium]|nr:FAD/NAD(P)-binding protein [Stellaceae bacterium]
MSSFTPAASGGPAEIQRPPAIAIIGAGFSGTLLSLHLLRRCPGSVRIHLVERSPRFGCGLAYSTGNLNHVLNVPTSRMSAFHDRPDDFFDWLRQDEKLGGGSVTPHGFVARKVFGEYVRHHLKLEFRKAAGRGGRLLLTRGEVQDLHVGRHGVTLQIDRGRQAEVDIAVLAVGNFPPEPPPIADRSFYDTDRYRPDPWAPEALAGIEPAAPVLLIGTGLTMVDTAISLLDRGHSGTIHALSRRGLLPRRHATPPSPAAALIERALPTTVAGLTRVLREEAEQVTARGGDWRAVIDGLRPATQELWQAMPAGERARFVRHLRPWWDVHRHRIPLEVADRIEDAIGRGQIRFGATRIRQMQVDADGATIIHRPRRSPIDQRLFVRRVINCSGPACDYERIADPLVRNLLARGDIRPDPLRLGLDVSSLCALRNRRGEIWQRLYAVGPVTRPAFWEVTSVPDIRRQCEALAAHLGTRLAAARPTASAMSTGDLAFVEDAAEPTPLRPAPPEQPIPV